MSRTFYCPLLLSLCMVCSGYKVLLVFPFPSNSFAVLGEAYVRLLTEAGHEVTYVAPFSIKNSTNLLRQIQVHTNVKLVPDKLWNITHILNKNKNLDDFQTYLKIAFELSKSTAMHADVQRLLLDTEVKFDAVVVDWLYNEILSGFSVVFNCPLIWTTSMEPNAFVLRLLNEDFSFSYISNHQSFSFGQWTMEHFRFLRMKYDKWLISDKESSVFNKAFGPAMAKRGRILPSFEEVKYNGSLVLGNSHPTIDRVPGLPLNYIPVSGYHIEDKNSLSEHVQSIMDKASEGVIIFSVGADFKSFTLPEALKTKFLNIFKELNKTVIWKYEDTFELPNNIHKFKWLTQQSMLAHPNCVLLITSGGLLSINEAIHFGIPIIGIPFLRNQVNNIDKAVSKGFAKKVELTDISTLKAAIDEVLNNSTFKAKVQELSLMYRDRPIPPSKELVFWIEHVIRTNGALHLRSIQPPSPWYQSLYFEVMFTAIIVVIILSVLIKCLLERRRREDSFEFKKFI